MTNGTLGPRTGTPSSTAARASALLVDNDVNMLFSLDFLLRSEGYHTVCARDGEAALQAMENACPDIVVLDITMPKINGYEVCQRIRANPAWREVKILFVSAKSHAIEIEKGFGLGADGYQTKPFSSADLLAKVAEVMSGCHPRTSHGTEELSGAGMNSAYRPNSSLRHGEMSGRADC